jgi:acyl-CoA synthetase (AMP-forming)/AMP-acid ligase II
MNLYAMLADPIRRLPDKAAITCGERSLTYRELDQACSATSAFYSEHGCRAGDRVLLFLKNGIDYPVLLLAAIRAGVPVVPVNAKLHPREVAWIAQDAEPKLIFAHRDQIAELGDALREGGKALPRLIAVEDFSYGSAAASKPAGDVGTDDAAWIFYTSGTTGRPKGATLTHRNLIACSTNCLADIFDFQSGDRVLHVAPLSHGSGLYLLPALARGATNIISDLPGFQPDQVLDIVAERKITALAFVAPTMIVRLLDARPRADIGSLRGVIYGGATIHLEHIKAAVARFGPIFHQLYGQGEAPMTIAYLPARDHLGASDEALLSAGYVRSGVEVRIVDENDAPVEEGGDGEICVRGDVVMKGYWQNEQASAAALRGGWLHTGDIGHFDSGGRLRVLDRRHDTIISGGTNIYPKEIEDVIAAHPLVREVIAFGIPDREWGESVAVALATNGKLGDAELLAFCRERLASFKKPKHVFFVDELPKNAYGKVLRRELRERLGGLAHSSTTPQERGSSTS